MKNGFKLFFCGLAALALLSMPRKSDAIESFAFLMSGSGAYPSGKELSTSLVIRSSGGKGINAAEGRLYFDPKQIKITKVSMDGSVFEMWIKGKEPKFDNVKGIVTFAGGTTKALKGGIGTILKISFVPLKAGNLDIKLATSSLSVLSADGLGVDTLKEADDGTYIFGNSAVIANAESLRKKLSGRILLQVEKDGRSWYVYPKDKKRYYLGRPEDAFNLMRKLALGVDHEYILKYKNKTFPSAMLGKILLDVKDSGKAYFIHPIDKKAYFLGRPADAFAVMRKLGMGILNKDIRKIPDWAI